MSDATDLYETDFMRWAEGQAEALRAARAAGANLPLDWDNLAEEIESLAKSQRSELRWRLDTIIEHLLKLQFSPATDPRSKWKMTVRRERTKVDDLIGDNPSLRHEIGPMIDAISGRVAVRVSDDLADRGELGNAAVSKVHAVRFAEHEVIREWFPEQMAYDSRT